MKKTPRSEVSGQDTSNCLATLKYVSWDSQGLATMLILHAQDGLGFVEPLRKVKYTPASKKKRHRPRRTIGGKSVASKYEGGVCGCAPSKKPNPFFVASALKKRPRNSLI